MEETKLILDAIKEMLEKIFDPVKDDVKNLQHDVYGNGKDGIKTKVAVMESTMESILKRMDVIEKKQDRAYWFSLTTTVGMIISIILIIAFK